MGGGDLYLVSGILWYDHSLLQLFTYILKSSAHKCYKLFMQSVASLLWDYNGFSPAIMSQLAHHVQMPNLVDTCRTITKNVGILALAGVFSHV